MRLSKESYSTAWGTRDPEGQSHLVKTVGSLWQSQEPGWFCHLHPRLRAQTQPG